MGSHVLGKKTASAAALASESAKQAEGPLSRLPPEVLLAILTALGSLDVFELWTAARVCRSWRHLAFDNSLWKHLYFQFWRVRQDAEMILADKVAVAKGDMHTAFPYFLRAARDSRYPCRPRDVSSYLNQVDWYRLYAARFVLEHRWHALDKPPSQLDQRLLPWSAPARLIDQDQDQGQCEDPRSLIPSEFQPPESFCMAKKSEEVKRAIYTAEIDDGADKFGRPWSWTSRISSGGQGSAATAFERPAIPRATPQRPRIISGARDCSVRIWDGETRALLFEATGHTGSVLRLRLDGHAGHLYTAGSDGKVIVWDYVGMVSQSTSVQRPEDLILHVIEHPDRVLDVVVGATHLVTCCMDGVARVFAKDDYTLTATHSHSRAINGACIPDDTGTSQLAHDVLTASSDKLLERWRLESGAAVQDVLHVQDVPTSVACGRGHLFVGTAQGAVLVRSEAEEFEWTGHQGIIRALAVAPDRGIVVSAGHDGRTFLWRIGEHDQPVFTLRRSPYGLLCVSTSVSKIVTGGKNGALCVRDFGDGLDVSIFA